MSINNALVHAANEVLRSYLAPELAEKLTEEILERARPEIEAAMTALAGFDFAKPAAARAKASSGQKAKAAKASSRKSKAASAPSGNEDFSTPPVVTVENYAAEAEPN